MSSSSSSSSSSSVKRKRDTPNDDEVNEALQDVHEAHAALLRAVRSSRNTFTLEHRTGGERAEAVRDREREHCAAGITRRRAALARAETRYEGIVDALDLLARRRHTTSLPQHAAPPTWGTKPPSGIYGRTMLGKDGDKRRGGSNDMIANGT